MPLRSLFATRFSESELPDPRLLAELEEACRSLAQEDKAGGRWSRAHGYRGYTSYASLDDLPKRDPRFADLVRLLDRRVAAFAADCAMDLGRRRLKLDSLWVNVLKPGGAHSGHIHPHSIVSGTVYVAVPPGSGALRLEDPRLPMMMAAPPRAPTLPRSSGPSSTPSRSRGASSSGRAGFGTRSSPARPQPAPAPSGSASASTTGETMRRVLVIGSPGAGKSTFAAALASRTGLEPIHLDRHYWRSGWTEPDLSEWAAEVAQLTARERWVMDGNYGGTLPLRLQRADTVVWLDFPVWLCLWRIVRRAARYRGRVRPDMAEGCPERLEWEFLSYTARFPWSGRRRIVEKLPAFTGTLVRLRRPREAARFLAALGASR